VIQQAGAPYSASVSTARPAHDTYEQEAERVARVVASGGPATRSERRADEGAARPGGDPTDLGRQLHAVVPGIQRLSINHCTPDHEKEILDALSKAVVELALTIQGIRTSNPIILPIVSAYFGTNAWATVADRLEKIQAGLPGATFECEYPSHVRYSFYCGGRSGYVHAHVPRLGLGEIHLCQPQFLWEPAAMDALLLVHEGAHRFLAAPGDVYYDHQGASCSENAETRGLSDAERLQNADSYACLVGSSVSAATPAVPAGGGP
jgi:hypothetical protein